MDGLGAAVVSPTRELAMQIFDVLRVAGKQHDLSAGLVIGGKDKSEEAERITRMNLLVCTPGWLLQHLDETVGFDASNLQMLVLDEADRILDLGFEASLSAIVQALPKQRILRPLWIELYRTHIRAHAHIIRQHCTIKSW